MRGTKQVGIWSEMRSFWQPHPTQDQPAPPEGFEIDSRIGAATPRAPTVSKEDSRPQAILKFRPPSSLDYKARHGPQTNSYMLNSKVKFNNYIFQYFFILMQKRYLLAKTKWEKCPISDILDKLTKLFQIGQVCASLCNNKPYPNFASKVVFFDAYHQYKLCF